MRNVCSPVDGHWLAQVSSGGIDPGSPAPDISMAAVGGEFFVVARGDGDGLSLRDLLFLGGGAD